jgi:hypothetical protein
VKAVAPVAALSAVATSVVNDSGAVGVNDVNGKVDTPRKRSIVAPGE